MEGAEGGDHGAVAKKAEDFCDGLGSGTAAMRRRLLRKQFQYQGAEFGAFVEGPNDQHLASVQEETQEFDAGGCVFDPFERVDAGWARWVFLGKTENDAGGPNDDIDGCAEVPGDMGRAAVVDEAGKASLGVG